MQWFKHYADLRDSGWVAPYLDSCDNEAEGYGIFCMILEKVEQEFVADGEPSASFTPAQWGRITRGSHLKSSKYLSKLRLIEGVTVEYYEGNVRVTVPKLRELKGRYSRVEERRTRIRKEESRAGHPLPDDFKVTTEMESWARSQDITADVYLETQKFVRHNRGRGTTAADWTATWELWMLRTKQYQPAAGGNNTDSVQADKHRRDLLRTARDCGLQRRPDESEDAFLARIAPWNDRRIAELERRANGSAEPGGLG